MNQVFLIAAAVLLVLAFAAYHWQDKSAAYADKAEGFLNKHLPLVLGAAGAASLFFAVKA